MTEPSFEIFRGIADRNALWVEKVEGLASARKRMEQIAAEQPGVYFVFSNAGHAILAHIDTSNKANSAIPDKESGAA